MADEIDWLDLPGRWTYGVDRGGRVFFINDEEKSTCWVHPGTASPIQSGHSSCPGLPKGWEMDSTQEGAVYFIKSDPRNSSGVSDFWVSEAEGTRIRLACLEVQLSASLCLVTDEDAIQDACTVVVLHWVDYDMNLRGGYNEGGPCYFSSSSALWNAPGALIQSEELLLSATGAPEALPGDGSCLSVAESSDQTSRLCISSPLSNSKHPLVSALLDPSMVPVPEDEDRWATQRPWERRGFVHSYSCVVFVCPLSSHQKYQLGLMKPMVGFRDKLSVLC
ncbi:hypothetical protein MJT46_010501 [Ovis ammon polii x Ovis aries]|nr:hypothetical protein MJT46_010501 [Ovis ammon polii x Ovis aries]